MTDPKSTQIITALRERLESDGYTVYLGDDPDSLFDDLPAVILGMAEEGLVTVQERVPRLRRMDLYAEVFFAVEDKPESEDPLVQGLLITADFENLLVRRPPKDAVDNLDGLADKIETTRQVVATRVEQSPIGLAQVELAVYYYDEG